VHVYSDDLIMSEELFVYSWEVLDENPIKIRAHCLDRNNVYRTITIDNYKAFSYVKPRDERYTDVHSSEGRRSERYLQTSDDLSMREYFIKNYSRWKQDLRGPMSEIPVLPMFTSVLGLDYTGWINAKTKKPIEKNVHPSPLVLSFDIEVSSLGSSMVVPYLETDRIEMISCVLQRYGGPEMSRYIIHIGEYQICVDNVTSILCKDEMEIVDCFFELIKVLNPDIIIGFNIYGFDFDFMISKMRYYLHYTVKCSRPEEKHLIIEETDWQSSAYGHNNFSKVKIGGRIVFDMMLYFKRFKLEQYSLGVISQTFLRESKEDMSYEEMFDCFLHKRDLNRVASYCIQDSMLVLKLFNKFNVWNELCELSKIMRCDIEDIYTRGEQLKVTNQVIKECIDRDVVLVKREPETRKDYQGATVLDPIVGVHDNCAVLDFQSLYPSIVIAFNICPSTYKSNFSKDNIGLFPHCLQKLLDARKKVKDIMKNENLSSLERIVLDKKQNALKISANSMYGTMGFASNVYFGCIPCAEKITSIGRKILIDTSNFIKENFQDIEIIYGDTDSCMLKSTKQDPHFINLAQHISKSVTSTLPEPIALNFEDYYDKIILMSKKRYIMVKKGGKLTYKGVMMARRGYCEYSKNVYKDVLNMIAKGNEANNIIRYIDESLLDLVTGQVPVEKLVMTKSVKDLNQYKSDVPQAIMLRRLTIEGIKIKAGERLRYVFVESDEKKQGYKMFTPEEVEKYSIPIDYRYYILTQIANQVDELLALIGICYQDYIKNWDPEVFM
jgi:DNA polymerase delta subunit 1